MVDLKEIYSVLEAYEFTSESLNKDAFLEIREKEGWILTVSEIEEILETYYLGIVEDRE